MTRNLVRIAVLAVAWTFGPATRLPAQETIRYGDGVPSGVRLMNKRALAYLAGAQLDDGSWPGAQSGPGVTGICVMAMMAGGEDPDFGPYATPIRKALLNLIVNQDAVTGHLSGPGHGPMYHHGFALLALSEAYGVVNERLLWQDSEVPEERRRTVGQALELAVRLAVSAQQRNPFKAWRYSPDSTDADTTVSGTVLMGLLGARNAGIEVPNRAIDDALAFFRLNTLRDGMVSYQVSQSHGTGITRAAIATLVYAVGKQKDTEEYRAVSRFIKARLDQEVTDHPFYYRYYMAQALFQSDFDAWTTWNQRAIDSLRHMQREDGSFHSSHGAPYGTGMSVLALALNYRLLPVYER